MFRTAAPLDSFSPGAAPPREIGWLFPHPVKVASRSSMYRAVDSAIAIVMLGAAELWKLDPPGVFAEPKPQIRILALWQATAPTPGALRRQDAHTTGQTDCDLDQSAPARRRVLDRESIMSLTTTDPRLEAVGLGTEGGLSVRPRSVRTGLGHEIAGAVLQVAGSAQCHPTVTLFTGRLSFRWIRKAARISPAE